MPPREIKKGGREIKSGARGAGRDSREARFVRVGVGYHPSSEPIKLKIGLLEGRASCEALPMLRT